MLVFDVELSFRNIRNLLLKVEVHLMRGTRPAGLVVLAGAVGMLGWGTVLPYQYAYAASSRGWGTIAAAAASSLFSVGALLAAPLGGRLADRVSPVRVAVVAKLVAALASFGLLVASTPMAFLAAMLVFGAGITAAQPAQAVLILRWVGSRDRRTVFAWQFTASSVGMAVGALLASQVVDLSTPVGMTPAFAVAAAGFVVSGALIALAGRVARGTGDTDEVEAGSHNSEISSGAGASANGFASTLRTLWAVPGIRWVAIVTTLVTLGFYAQFESGLPAYALLFLDVPERTIGIAAAVNCLVIVALQMVVVRWTARRDA
ncbi:MAG: MFS transporter, partial [Lapillicoccus sp.]